MRVSIRRHYAKSCISALRKALNALRSRRSDIGRKGERQAVRWLKRRGFSIIARNYSGRAGEIDIITCRRGALHFIEVKTRSRRSADFLNGLEAVDQQKLARIEKAAVEFLNSRKQYAKLPHYFDAISITYSGQFGAYGCKLEYVTNLISAQSFEPIVAP